MQKDKREKGNTTLIIVVVALLILGFLAAVYFGVVNIDMSGASDINFNQQEPGELNLSEEKSCNCTAPYVLNFAEKDIVVSGRDCPSEVQDFYFQADTTNCYELLGTGIFEEGTWIAEQINGSMKSHDWTLKDQWGYSGDVYFVWFGFYQCPHGGTSSIIGVVLESSDDIGVIGVSSGDTQYMASKWSETKTLLEEYK